MTARVLVVDDVRANVDLLEAKLESRFFLVETALDGASALRCARESQPDVILLDVMMPGLDGFQVCEALKADPATAHIPVVLITALGERDYRLRGLKAGADDFLTKPAKDTTLFARVKSLARLKMMMDEWRSRLSTIQDLGIEVPRTEGSIPDEPGCVAVAEPDSLEVETIMAALHQDGHEALSVPEALGDPARLNAGEADAIVVGLQGDPAAGLRLVSAIRAAPETRFTPVLLAAPEASAEAVAHALDLGANDYVLKPVETEEFRARIKTQLRRRRYQDLLGHGVEDGLRLALIDELTGLYNRRYLISHLGRLLASMARREKPLAAAMIDIDRFKQINDEMGHGYGDKVLRAVARRVADQVRPSDTLARLGGEEFVVLMPETREPDARDVAERLRQRVAEAPVSISGEQPAAVTVSCGIACALPGAMDADGLLQAADKALYQAKENGRNRTVAASELD